MSLTEIVQLEGHIQSIYLAVYPDKLLLLDGCCRPDVPLVLDYIKHTLQRPITDLKVVVTHMHADHAGGALLFRQATGCQIVSSDKSNQWYAGVGGRVMHFIDTSLAYWVARRLGRPTKRLWYPAHLTPDITVVDGQRLPHFEDWQVLVTAGHTDRDLSLYHPQTQRIYTADLIIKLRHKFVAPVPIYLPQVYRESLKRVKQLNPEQVMMAHGGAKYVEPEVFDQLIQRVPERPVTVKATIEHKLFWWFKRPKPNL
ncbi:MBL fold metallo-hydrolase [Psychrobacter sp. FDAARGOS_221]|uniref:MBL fold metallo-hydrolase n=1 Tax=Psychrobacter sp. FDAARGOS_221 TaxID=1975705 RepID=UPI000BB572FD|nr:MBL fold metallo-hydrolase [Psychrobacter sp. FDAARGOS_221]PNK59880.1 Zn-dependent hydrolase [Psychrobacter sp. FDAARGOS_221]